MSCERLAQTRRQTASRSRSGSQGASRPPSSHRTVQVLFTYGSSGRQVFNPAAGRFFDLDYPSGSTSCTGAPMCGRLARHRSAMGSNPRSAKYALRSARSTVESWLSTHRDLRP